MDILLKFLNELEDRKIHYKLSKIRESVLVEIAVPGERWEVEFFKNGSIDIEKFISNGQIYNESEIDVLLNEFSN